MDEKKLFTFVYDTPASKPIITNVPNATVSLVAIQTTALNPADPAATATISVITKTFAPPANVTPVPVTDIPHTPDLTAITIKLAVKLKSTRSVLSKNTIPVTNTKQMFSKLTGQITKDQDKRRETEEEKKLHLTR